MTNERVKTLAINMAREWAQKHPFLILVVNDYANAAWEFFADEARRSIRALDMVRVKPVARRLALWWATHDSSLSWEKERYADTHWMGFEELACELIAIADAAKEDHK